MAQYKLLHGVHVYSNGAYIAGDIIDSPVDNLVTIWNKAGETRFALQPANTPATPIKHAFSLPKRFEESGLLS